MASISDCRVSTEEHAQEGISPAAQEGWVRVHCAAASLTLVATVRDEGVSAATSLGTRPGGTALLLSVKTVMDWLRRGQLKGVKAGCVYRTCRKVIGAEGCPAG
jgi:hypothetical protein